MNKYKYDDSYFEKIDREDKAYWLGFLYADGCIYPIKKNEKIKAMQLDIALQDKDVDVLEKLKVSLDTNVPIKEKVVNLKGKKHNCVRVRINNTKLCRDLISLGCTPNKSLSLKFPKDLIPKELIRHFIRGYFDGDGCISFSRGKKLDKRNGKSYEYCSASVSFIGTEDFTSVLVNILSQHDIFFKNNKHHNSGKAFEIRLYSNSQLLSFYNFLYSNSSIFMKRKKDKFEEFFYCLELKNSSIK